MSELKQYSYNTLGFDLSFNGPATAEDIDRALGTPGACAEAFMLNFYAYQKRNVEFRKKFCEALEAHCATKRLLKTVPAGKGGTEEKEKFAETEQEYLNRVRALGEITDADAGALAIRINDELGDWSPTQLTSRKPSAVYYKDADGLLAKIGAGQSTNDRLTANLEGQLGVNFASQFGEFNRDNLARALQALDEKRKRDAANSLLG